MELYLAHKIFEDIHKSYALEDAKEKAFLFIKSLDDIEELGGDYWIQISKEWDLNIWWEDSTSCEMTLYPCTIGVDDFFHDDTSNGINITNPLTVK